MPTEPKQDELILHLIATGLVAVRKIADGGQALSHPYPAPLQRGWNQLVLLCLRKGIAPPVGIDELFDWCCERPLVDWPLALPEPDFGQSDTLIDGPFLTETCEEWACANQDVEAELTENSVMEAAIGICKLKKAQASYVAFRTLLIRQPVLTKSEYDKLCIDPLFAPLQSQLAEAYIVAPESYIFKGHFHCCPYCGGLLQFTGETFICEQDRCRGKGWLEPAHRVAAGQDKVLYLKRGLRRFVTVPGQAEIYLADQLEKLGLAVELWPAVEAYDLRVVFPDGKTIWAIEVKDRKNPIRLARDVHPFPDTPIWTQAFFAFPDERRRKRSDYKRAFDANCQFLNHQIRSTFIEELLTNARKQLRQAD